MFSPPRSATLYRATPAGFGRSVPRTASMTIIILRRSRRVKGIPEKLRTRCDAVGKRGGGTLAFSLEGRRRPAGCGPKGLYPHRNCVDQRVQSANRTTRQRPRIDIHCTRHSPTCQDSAPPMGIEPISPVVKRAHSPLMPRRRSGLGSPGFLLIGCILRFAARSQGCRSTPRLVCSAKCSARVPRRRRDLKHRAALAAMRESCPSTLSPSRLKSIVSRVQSECKREGEHSSR